MDTALLDYNFTIGERAQFIAVAEDGSDLLFPVRVVDCKEYKTGVYYVVSLPETEFDTVGLEQNQFLTDHYYAELLPGHAATLVSPDELYPYFKSFKLVIDNNIE